MAGTKGQMSTLHTKLDKHATQKLGETDTASEGDADKTKGPDKGEPTLKEVMAAIVGTRTSLEHRMDSISV